MLLLNEQFVRHPSNHLLAKIVVYTKHKTLLEISAEIGANLGLFDTATSQRKCR